MYPRPINGPPGPIASLAEPLLTSAPVLPASSFNERAPGAPKTRVISIMSIFWMCAPQLERAISSFFSFYAFIIF